ncbi:MAG: hypothetical protein K2K56_13295 [Lachnospiraceae bacterium]|nr:hypothetical protein [Lachnospiraceae bacterium]
MVIMFRGTNISRNNAPQTLALFAGLTVVKFGRKTLILQFSTNYSVEEYLIGKQIRDQAIHSEINMFDDVGIDAMLRRVETQKIDAKHFSTFSQELYAEPNMFDLAQRSKKEDFEEEIVTRERDVAKLLGYAKEIYDDIYILVNGKKDKVVEMMNKLVDISFVCVPQGNAQEHTAMSDNSKILVTNYDSRSSYDLKSMQKRYGVGEIASVPFNVTFRDYCYSNNLIRFIMTNDKVGPGDDNYALFSSVSSIIEKIHDGELMELSDPAFDFEKKLKVESSEEKIHYSEKNVKKEVKRKGFFRKREEVTVHFSETGFDKASSSIDEPGSTSRKKKNDTNDNKKKRRFTRKSRDTDRPEQQSVDPENYDEFSDLEYISEEFLSDDSSEDAAEYLEDGTEEEEYYEEEDLEEDDEFPEEDAEEQYYEEDPLEGADEVSGEDAEEQYYEEDALEGDDEVPGEDAEEQYYEEKPLAEDDEVSGKVIEEETSASTSQSQAKKQQELLDYIRKYCEDRKYRLSKADLISINQKPYVMDYYDGWKKEYVTTLWREFESIPVDPQTNAITDNWQEFPAGTGSEVIKSWFIYNYGTDIMNSIIPKKPVKKKTTNKPRGKKTNRPKSV